MAKVGYHGTEASFSGKEGLTAVLLVIGGLIVAYYLINNTDK